MVEDFKNGRDVQRVRQPGCARTRAVAPKPHLPRTPFTWPSSRSLRLLVCCDLFAPHDRVREVAYRQRQVRTFKLDSEIARAEDANMTIIVLDGTSGEPQEWALHAACHPWPRETVDDMVGRDRGLVYGENGSIVESS